MEKQAKTEDQFLAELEHDVEGLLFDSAEVERTRREITEAALLHHLQQACAALQHAADLLTGEDE